MTPETTATSPAEIRDVDFAEGGFGAVAAAVDTIVDARARACGPLFLAGQGVFTNGRTSHTQTPP